MKELFKKYLMQKYEWESLEIKEYYIEGVDARVTIYTHPDKIEVGTESINVWEMMEFLHEN